MYVLTFFLYIQVHRTIKIREMITIVTNIPAKPVTSPVLVLLEPSFVGDAVRQNHSHSIYKFVSYL